MRTPGATHHGHLLVSGALGVAAACFAVAYLLDMQVPFIANDRAAIYVLAATGFAMCGLNMGRTFQRLGWQHPVSLIGMFIGGVIILLVVARAADWPLPLLADDRAVFGFVAIAGLVKWALGSLSRMYLQA
jgi:hypothetical protein